MVGQAKARRRAKRSLNFGRAAMAAALILLGLVLLREERYPDLRECGSDDVLTAVRELVGRTLGLGPGHLRWAVGSIAWVTGPVDKRECGLMAQTADGRVVVVRFTLTRREAAYDLEVVDIRFADGAI